jgi:integrase
VVTATCSFSAPQGERLGVHGVQYLLSKHRMAASKLCPSLKEKRVTVHRLRHTMAMDLLQAGVDRSVCITTVRLKVEENQLVDVFGEFGVCTGRLKSA